jgi:hypothetical protein
MGQPPISRAEAIDVVRFLSGALADGFKLSGYPSAFEETHRRFVRTHKSTVGYNTIRHRILRAKQLYGISASAQKGKRLKAPYRGETPKADVKEAADAVLFWLQKNPEKRRQNGTLVTTSELAMRTKLRVSEVKIALETLKQRGVNIHSIGGGLEIPRHLPTARTSGRSGLELLSRDDNTFLISGIGDLHAASKYCRWDVREDLIKRAEAKGVQAIFDTGNWIEGESHFNRYELEAIGLDPQCHILARKHPRTSIPIYAVTGDDHEGWYAKRDGLDVGRYAESIMRTEGHNWTNLGYMEAEVTLRNAKSGKTSKLLVSHPGGGSAYATSYSIQKIVESFEGGEKPAVGLFGHYHKLWCGLIRNVWVAQTGTTQDQSSFQRKMKIEAHVGGIPWIELEQDPRTGAILSMTAPLVRYFNTGYYESGRDRWSHHGPVKLPKRSRGAIRT